MTQPTPPPSLERHGPVGADDTLRDAARWWEPRRVLYNAALGALLVRTWARISPELTGPNVLRLGVLALLANVCYSAAYLVDFPVQAAFDGAARTRWRWVIWTAGSLFAALFETYWYLDEILPPIR